MIRATYRLQFHKGFTFSDAAKRVDYFAALGISHIYASPILTARAGSLHGYDVVDHAHVNPELGGEEGFRALAAALKQRDIGIILDIVPNHMAVGKADNPWWLDVLEKGHASRYANYFDIDWDAPGLEGKIFAPFLGEAPEAALAKGDLKLVRDGRGKPAFAYFEHLFPLRPEDQENAAGDPQALLARQNFVLADWREADARLNWRRFFDITDLAAIRPGAPDVFEAIHAKIFGLYRDDLIQGVRVDHVDGIADPRAYCRRLRDRFEAIRPGAYIVVEKILADGEVLPADWQVNGTTGYDFMNEVSALIHQPDRGALERLWQRQSRRGLSFDEEEQRARKEMLLTKFAGQRAAVARAVAGAIGQSQEAVDAALIAIITRLRCYRSYATGEPNSPEAGHYMTEAFSGAAIEVPHLKPAIDAIASMFGGKDAAAPVKDALRRFSQLSAPVAAKSVEDTAFYRYGRILSRNDVGFDPRRHMMSGSEFHRRMTERASAGASAMLATATHDHKRGEDARARIAALSHAPELWEEFISEAPAPGGIDAADRYQLYQALVGSWPAEVPGKEFAERIAGWCAKYLREGKLRSSWAMPNQDYEKAFCDFARQLIIADETADFRARFTLLLARIRPQARANTLIQLVLRNCVPGIPDLYQGCEFEDLSLVDPDNRRPVDFAARAAALARAGVTKQTAIARLLAARRQDPELWAKGDYRPLPLPDGGDDILGFSRSHMHSRLIVVLRRRMQEARGALVLDRPYRELLAAKTVMPGQNALADLLGDHAACVLYSDGRGA